MAQILHLPRSSGTAQLLGEFIALRETGGADGLGRQEALGRPAERRGRRDGVAAVRAHERTVER